MLRTFRAVSLALLVVGVPALAAAQAPSIPRPEFPNPQFERADWLNLNGPWRFAFDDGDAGVRERWYAGERTFDRQIVVPFAFESPKSGIGDRTFHPVVWYARDVEVPAAWKGRRVLLKFGAVDYRATVWLNGQKLGDHEGGSTPFSFDITDVARDGASRSSSVPKTLRPIASSRAASSTGRRGPKASSTRARRASGRRCGWRPWATATSRTSARILRWMAPSASTRG